jgi:small subunit ribosomal protein S19e
MAKKLEINPKEIEPGMFLGKLSENLKSVPEIVMPKWAEYVKTGSSRMRPPEAEDWWHARSASILRQAYIRGVVGVSKLKTKYGSAKKRGVKPKKFKKSSGKIIRTILQQSEKAGLVEKVKSKKSGRRLTKKGKELLEKIALDISKK